MGHTHLSDPNTLDIAALQWDMKPYEYWKTHQSHPDKVSQLGAFYQLFGWEGSTTQIEYRKRNREPTDS